MAGVMDFGGYSDWKRYAGFDEKSGTFTGTDYVNQAIANSQKRNAQKTAIVPPTLPTVDQNVGVIQPDTAFGSASQPSFGAPQPQNPYAITPQASSVGVSPSLGNSASSWRDRLKSAIQTNIGD